MRIGAKKEYENRSSMLYEWEGHFFDSPRFPQEATDFILTQFDRFGIPYPPQELLDYCLITVWNVMVYRDSYLWVSDITDLTYTDDWMKYTYEMKDLDGETIECDPEKLETFRHLPGNDEKSFLEILAKPGLDSVDYGYLFTDELLGESGGDTVFDSLSPRALQELRDIAQGRSESMYPFADIASWAALAWILGPYGKEFRDLYVSVAEACYAYGECILYEGCIYTPKQYKVHLRAPQSCIVCGLDSWCVELVVIDGVSRYMCEHHVNGGKTEHEFLCGTKFCRHVECPHHPRHGKDLTQIDYVRNIHGLKQGMVEWSGKRSTKQIGII
jgi:hypothetical protein